MRRKIEVVQRVYHASPALVAVRPIAANLTEALAVREPESGQYVLLQRLFVLKSSDWHRRGSLRNTENGDCLPIGFGYCLPNMKIVLMPSKKLAVFVCCWSLSVVWP